MKERGVQLRVMERLIATEHHDEIFEVRHGFKII